METAVGPSSQVCCADHGPRTDRAPTTRNRAPGTSGRTARANPAGLLEGVRDLEEAPVVLVTPHDLEPDRQPFRREAAWDRNRRVADDRNEVARLHPVDIRLHRHAF